jgi:hypothetical protein
MIHELGIPIEAPGVLDSNAMDKVGSRLVSKLRCWSAKIWGMVNDA